MLNVVSIVDDYGSGRGVMMLELADFIEGASDDLSLRVLSLKHALYPDKSVRKIVEDSGVLHICGHGRVGRKIKAAGIKHPRKCLTMFVDRWWDREQTKGYAYPRLSSEAEVELFDYASLSVLQCSLRRHLEEHSFTVTRMDPGIDTDRYTPKLSRSTFDGPGIVLGCVGNSREFMDGFAEYVGPVVYNMWSSIEYAEGIELLTAFKNQATRRDDPYGLISFSPTATTFARTSAMIDFYRSIDVLVSVPRSGDGPRAALEAAACGVPIIGSNVGILPRLIEYGETHGGILVERSHKEIEAAIKQLFHNREELRARSNAAIEAAKNYDWRVVGPAWIDYFKECGRM